MLSESGRIELQNLRDKRGSEHHNDHNDDLDPVSDGTGCTANVLVVD